MGIFQIFSHHSTNLEQAGDLVGYMYVHIDESLRTYIHIENVLVMELKVHTYIKVIPMYGYIHLVGTTIQVRAFWPSRRRQKLC